MTPNEITEQLRFWLGLIGFILPFNCLRECVGEVLWVNRIYPADGERRRTARGWLRDATGRWLACLGLTTSGFLLIISPPSNLAMTWPGIAINWIWVIVAAHQVAQGVAAHLDRYQTRKLRPEAMHEKEALSS